ncbi:MAG: hypothetical protein MPF33_05650 [Candidatus Aramenus sp.]|nr:hypothetical protein [Candidatus Aramenus sp.]
MKVVLVGLTREGKVVEKVFLTERGLVDVQKGEGFISISLEGLNCVERQGVTLVNGEEADAKCVDVVKEKVKCVDELLKGLDACSREDLVDQVRLLDEKVKYVVYVVQEDEVIPFTGDHEIDSLAFRVVEEYKRKYRRVQ